MVEILFEITQLKFCDRKKKEETFNLYLLKQNCLIPIIESYGTVLAALA